MNSRAAVNNAIYNELGDRWYTSQGDSVALLRIEAAFRNPWILEELRRRLGDGPIGLLDIGCGGGFLTNYLAQHGVNVTGVDLAQDSLDVAHRFDRTGTVRYVRGNAEGLDFPDASFDAVTCMDVLEHVEKPDALVADAARVLKPGGTFFYYTFNRNFATWLVVVKGVEWFVRNTPPRLHVYHLLVKPEEMCGYCERAGLRINAQFGISPDIFSFPFWKLLCTRTVPPDFRFTFTRFMTLGYMGIAIKQPSTATS